MVSRGRGRASRGYRGSLAPSECLQQGSVGEHAGSLSLPRPGCTLLHFSACATVSWLNDLDEERSNNGSVGCTACGLALASGKKKSAVDFAGQVKVKGQLPALQLQGDLFVRSQSITHLLHSFCVPGTFESIRLHIR